MSEWNGKIVVKKSIGRSEERPSGLREHPVLRSEAPSSAESAHSSPWGRSGIEAVPLRKVRRRILIDLALCELRADCELSIEGNEVSLSPWPLQLLIHVDDLNRGKCPSEMRKFVLDFKIAMAGSLISMTCRRLMILWTFSIYGRGNCRRWSGAVLAAHGEAVGFRDYFPLVLLRGDPVCFSCPAKCIR